MSGDRCRTLFGAVMVTATLGIAVPAKAGGYDTGGRDWDFLFQEQTVAGEAGVRYIMPRRTLSNIVGPAFGPSIDTAEAEAFAVPHASLAVRLGDAARCMASYREPFGGHADYGTAWAYTASAVEQHFSSADLGLTCAASMAAGKGRLHVLGGVSYQEIDYELTQINPVFGPTSTNVSDSGVAWRIGLAYDIPEYALRASLVYNSAVDYRMTGTFTAGGRPVPIFGDITMPQSLQLRAQTGVAPNWLAFGSVTWTDWSVTDNMPLCAVGTPVCTQAAAVSGLTLIWKDTWTVTVGAAHRFNEMVTATASLTWDQGATQGFTSQTDTWLASLNAIITPAPNAELRVGGGIGVMAGGSLSTMMLPGGIPNPVGYTATFGDDVIYTLNAAAKVRF